MVHRVAESRTRLNRFSTEPQSRGRAYRPAQVRILNFFFFGS